MGKYINGGIIGVLIIGGALFSTRGTDSQNKEIESFSSAKRIIAQIYEPLGNETFYCGCEYSITNKSRGSGTVDLVSCGYEHRKNATRAKRIEWEHVVPASRIGANRTCWNAGHAECDKPGRDCCNETDEWFRFAQSDLHNLVPAIGEVNGDRSNREFGIIRGEDRVYGQCDFEIDFAADIVEPSDKIKGQVARTYLHMSKTYGIILTSAELRMYNQWNRKFPPTQEEKLRNSRIRNKQGTNNDLVSSPYSSYGN